jgi:hypothetical protein
MTNTTAHHKTTNVIVTKHLEKNTTYPIPLATRVIVGLTVGPAYGPTRQNQWARSYGDMAAHVSMTPPLRSHSHVAMWVHRLMVPLFRMVGHQPNCIGSAFFRKSIWHPSNFGKTRKIGLQQFGKPTWQK